VARANCFRCHPPLYRFRLRLEHLQLAVDHVFGVTANAADDWSLSEVVWIFTVAIVFLGLAAAVAGRWLEKVGPRMVGTVGACCWGGGYLVGAVGIYTHQLWLLYLGYGAIGGVYDRTFAGKSANLR
jgi:MFS family permease